MQKLCRTVTRIRPRIPKYLPRIPRCGPISLPIQVPVGDLSNHAAGEGTTIMSSPKKSVPLQKPTGAAMSTELGKLELLLKVGDLTSASETCKRLLEGEAFQASRPELYESCIALFAKYRNWASVNSLWREMNDNGFIPSNKLRTMLVPFLLGIDTKQGLLPRSQTAQLKKEVMETLFADEGFMCSVLANMSKNGVDPSACEDLLRNYAELRGPGWIPSYNVTRTMAAMYIRRGAMSDYLRWVRHAGPASNNASETGNFTPSQFGRLLDLASSKTLFDKSQFHLLEKLLNHPMAAKHPNRVAYNVLLGAVVNKQDFAAVQRVYNKLCSAVIPDAFSFASMFKAHEGLRLNASKRQSSVSSAPKPRLTPRPRTLFGQLIQAHNSRCQNDRGSPFRRTSILTSRLLQVIVRSYLTLQDYAASYVAIETFDKKGIPPTSDLNRMVWEKIVQRIVKQASQRKLFRNSAYVRAVSASVHPRHRRRIHLPTSSDRDSSWAGRMVDTSEKWEELFTVQEQSHEMNANNRSVGTFLPYRELIRRIEARLRHVLQFTLKDVTPPSGSLEQDGQSIGPNPDSNSPRLSWGDMVLLMALLRRAVIMQRLPSVRSPSCEEEETFRRELGNAHRDMSTLTLPLLSSSQVTT